MNRLRAWWVRHFGRKTAALPPALPPLERWHADYTAWLGELQRVFAAFPDHEVLEGVPVSEAEGLLLDEISDLYADDACRVVEGLVLKGESLRRRLSQGQHTSVAAPAESNRGSRIGG